MGETLRPPKVSAYLRRHEATQKAALELVRQIRKAAAWLKDKHNYTFDGLAELTNLHRNSVMKLSADSDWVPEPKTMDALSQVLIEQQRLKQGLPPRIALPRRGRPRSENGSDVVSEKEPVSRNGETARSDKAL